jgi:hypothetical protein
MLVMASWRRWTCSARQANDFAALYSFNAITPIISFQPFRDSFDRSAFVTRKAADCTHLGTIAMVNLRD